MRAEDVRTGRVRADDVCSADVPSPDVSSSDMPSPDLCAEDVRAGLLARPRSLPPMYFYDELGSRLFLVSIMTAVPLCVAAAELAPGAAGVWPQFRGPGGLGLAAGEHPVEWSASVNVRWSVEVPGHGWSSPVVWGDRVFVTSAISLGDWKQPTAGKVWKKHKRSFPTWLSAIS